MTDNRLEITIGRLVILEAAVKQLFAVNPDAAGRFLATLDVLGIDPQSPHSAYVEGAAVEFRRWIIEKFPHLRPGAD